MTVGQSPWCHGLKRIRLARCPLKATMRRDYLIHGITAIDQFLISNFSSRPIKLEQAIKTTRVAILPHVLSAPRLPVEFAVLERIG